jgi:hypothetical protein
VLREKLLVTPLTTTKLFREERSSSPVLDSEKATAAQEERL